LNVPSDAQMELYLIIFCLLWFAFTVGNYAEWAVDFDAGTWWWNYWDFTYLSDRFRIALEIDPLRGS
jgi:hypothetical protein